MGTPSLCVKLTKKLFTTQLPIQIYYESLCPDSVRFVQRQLGPNYEALKDYVDILFVPFGKSFSTTNKDKSVSFDCQHGPAECDGNRIQSCVLNHLAGDQDAQTAFVACQMTFNADPSGTEVGNCNRCSDSFAYLNITHNSSAPNK